MQSTLNGLCLIAASIACMPALAEDMRTSASDDLGAYAEVRLQQQYDGIAIRRFDGDWSRGFAPHAGRNLLFQRNRAAAGLEKDGWRVGYEFRQEAFLATDRQTMDFIALVKQHVRPDVATSYNLQAHLQSWRASGLQVGRLFHLPAFASRPTLLDVSVSLYGAPVYRDNRVAGTVDYTPPQTFGANLIQRDANSRGDFPFRAGSTSGNGASISAAIKVAVTDAIEARLRIDDLFSRLRLTGLPVTVQRANTAAAQFDSRNFVSFQPVLSGMNTQEDITTALPRYASAALDYTDGAWSGQLQLDRYAGVSMPQAGLSHQFSWGKVTGSYLMRYQAIGLAYEYGQFRIGAQTDALHASRANAINFQTSYSHRF